MNKAYVKNKQNKRKERTKEQRISTTKQISSAADIHFIYKQHIQASSVVIARFRFRSMSNLNIGTILRI
jgi:hypothetical protein